MHCLASAEQHATHTSPCNQAACHSSRVRRQWPSHGSCCTAGCAQPWPHRRVVALRLEGKHSDEEEEQQLQRGGDAVVQEGGDAAEDAPRDDDGVDDGAQAGLREHDVRGRARLPPAQHFSFLYVVDPYLLRLTLCFNLCAWSCSTTHVLHAGCSTPRSVLPGHSRAWHACWQTFCQGEHPTEDLIGAC